MSKPSPFAGWRVSLGHHFGRCAAEVRREGVGGGQCFRSGLYGWHGQGFCYQHHPDWYAWRAEGERLELIAQTAVNKEVAR